MRVFNKIRIKENTSLLLQGFILILILGCNSVQKIYVERDNPPTKSHECMVHKDTFTTEKKTNFLNVGRYTYDQQAEGIMYSFNNKDSSFLVQNLAERKVMEYKVPYSLQAFDYFFCYNNYAYFIGTNENIWLKWKIGSDTAVIQNIYPPNNYLVFNFETGYIAQPVVSPNGKFVVFTVWDTKRSFLKSRNIDVYVDIETGKSYPINIQISDKYQQGWFLPVISQSREWLTDSTLVYSFDMDENLYVINIYTGAIQAFDGRSQYQTEIIKPQPSKKQPSKDDFAEYYQYNDYYPRMVLNRARGELYRIYKKRMPEKNEKGEFTTRAELEHSIVVFDLQLNKKCEIDMPVSERYVWQFAPSKNGLFYDLFVDPVRYKNQPYEKFMEIRFND